MTANQIRRGGICAWVVLLALAWARVAHADGFDGQRFVPAAGAAGGLIVERPIVPQHLGFGVGLYLNYGYDAVVDRDRPAGVTRHVLRHEFSLDLIGSIGLGNIFELAAALPIDAVYLGDVTTIDGQRLAAGAGVGDLRLVPKLAWQFGKTRLNYGIGFMLPITFPTGDDNSLRGAGGFQLVPTLLAAIGGWRWNFTANLGFRWRTNGKNPDFTGGKELTFGFAGTFGLVTGRVGLDLLVEVAGGWQPSALGKGSIAIPVEVLPALVVKPTREWSIYLGGAAGLDNGLATPDFRALVGVRYAHRVPGDDRFKDSDGDGIPNGRDRCPYRAEDEDGFEDDDGCPENDNDHDGVLDDDDECPDQAEEPGGDGDGCPDHARVIMRRGRILIIGKIHFDSGSAHVQKRSDPLLDQIAVMMRDHPEVGRVRVEGYTDNVGPPDMNLRLSRERAGSVRAALIERGVAKERLRSEGFGETHPVAPNRTRAGRAKNRRVEFASAQ